VGAVEAKGNSFEFAERVNDESAMTFEPCRLAGLVKIEITTNHNFKSTKQLYRLVSLLHGMASPAIACIGIIGKYVRVFYALRAMR
jgi:hypothetical protein